MTRHEANLNVAELRDAADTAATLAAAVDSGLFEALAEGDGTPARIASRRDMNERAVAILLAFLADLGLAEERDDGGFRLTDGARRRFGDPSSPEYEGGGLPLWLHNLRSWTRLPEVLRTGEPAGQVGEGEEDENAIARFMAGMAAAPKERVLKAVDHCLGRKPDARTLLDLGGGPGHYSRAFIERGLEATLMDLPATVDYVAEAYELADVDGLDLARGDFTTDPLPDGPFDIVHLSNILHIYSPERNREILRKAAAVTAPGGVAAILDFVRGRSPIAARFALVMLLNTEGGNTYTEDEYREWLGEAGFGEVRVDDIDPERQLVTGVRE